MGFHAPIAPRVPHPHDGLIVVGWGALHARRAAEQIGFNRGEHQRSEERRQLREISQQLMYQRLSPKARLREDARRAEELTGFTATPALTPNTRSTHNPFRM